MTIKGNMDSGVNNSINAGETNVSTGAAENQESGTSVGGAETTDAEGEGEADAEAGSVFDEGENSSEELEDNSSVFDEVEGEGDAEGSEDAGEAEDFEYEFDFPEGAEIDEEMLGKTTTEFKKLGIPKDKARALMKLGLEAQRRAEIGVKNAWDKQTIKWKRELKADPELGGANFDGTLQNSLEVLNQFEGGKEFKEVLKSTNIGNSPAVNRFLNSVHKAMNEDGFEQARYSAPPREMSDAELFYPELAERDRLMGGKQ